MGIFGFGKKAKDSNTNQPQATKSPSGEQNVNFDVLVNHLQAKNDREAMDALWGAVYSLPEWYFVPRGELPNIHPFVGIVEGRPFINAFTDHKLAHEFSIRQGFVSPDDTAHVLSMPVGGFIETVPSYQEHGVFGLLFNDGPYGFFAPLQNLRPMLLYYQTKRGSTATVS
jgi:hypothetical protein